VAAEVAFLFYFCFCLLRHMYSGREGETV